jgi:hypothetical protein
MKPICIVAMSVDLPQLIGSMQSEDCVRCKSITTQRFFFPPREFLGNLPIKHRNKCQRTVRDVDKTLNKL